MNKLSFIGLGIMGKPMAKNLMKAGYSLVVYDILPSAIEEMVKYGAQAASSVAEAASCADTIITMLPNSPQVIEVCADISKNAKPGTLVIDMSSIAPSASQDVEKNLAANGIHMIDAPVSGGEPKAVDATLSIMCGGKQEHFDRALPILKCLGSSAVLVGSIGAGNTCKLANQIVVALNIAAVSEAFMLAKRAGVDPALVFDAIKGGLAGSTVMNAKAPMMLAHNYKPGFKIDLHIKDLANALQTGAESGAPLLLTASVMQILQNLKLDGHGPDDHSAIALFYEKLANECL